MTHSQSQAGRGAQDERVRVLVVEDGEEYIRNLQRFLSQEFLLQRAGDGAAALAALRPGGFDVVFLDMRFDRVPAQALLGDLQGTADRFNGDLQRARQFLEENQGTYILAALRAEGFAIPVVFSRDFSGEPRRWDNLARRYGPLDFLPDNAGPEQVSACLRSWATARVAPS